MLMGSCRRESLLQSTYTPGATDTRQRIKYRRQSLCRELHSANVTRHRGLRQTEIYREPITGHSAKSLPSVERCHSTK